MCRMSSLNDQLLFSVGESVNYWEVRHKILTRPEESVAVIKCLTQVGKKVNINRDIVLYYVRNGEPLP